MKTLIKNSFLNLMLHSRHCQHHYHLWFVLTLKLSALTVAQEYSSTVRYVGPVTVICIWNKPCLVSGWFTDLHPMNRGMLVTQKQSSHLAAWWCWKHIRISLQNTEHYISPCELFVLLCVFSHELVCVLYFYMCSAFYVYVHQDVDLPVS